MIKSSWAELVRINLYWKRRIMPGMISIMTIGMLLPLSCNTSPKATFSKPNAGDRQASTGIGLSGMGDSATAGDAHAAANIKFNVNSRAADMLHTWFDDTSNEEIARKLSTEPGTQIMAACARAARANETLPKFSDELARFKQNHEQDKDPYHIHRAWKQRRESAELLAALKATISPGMLQSGWPLTSPTRSGWT